MCGIVGILGQGPVAGLLVDALKRLEYRGYDSAGIATLDMTPVWYKQLVLVGSVDHGADPSSVMGRVPEGLDHSIDAALEVLAHPTFPPELLVTHEFPLEGYREAVRAGLDKGTSRALKVVFRPNG